MSLFSVLLFTHVLGAIIAFGPTFSFPIIGRMGAAERDHGPFAARVSSALSRIQVLPLAIVQGITGTALIIVGSIDLLNAPWLLVSILLYLIAIGYAIFVQTPTVKRAIALSAGGPPSGAPGGPSRGADGPRAGGPPPELIALGSRIRRGSLLLIVLVVSIVFLMVTKPF